jgi:hypothetical protein
VKCLRPFAIFGICLGLLSYSEARPGPDSNYNVSISGGGGGPVTWDGSHKSTNFTLSGGNLTATATGTNTNGQNTRSTTSHSSGKYYIELSLTTVAVAADYAFGIANSSQANDNSFLGDGTQNGYAWYIVSQVVFNNANVHTIQSCGAGHVAQMAIDTGAKLVWFNCDNGNWNNNAANDPAAGSGGFDFSALTGAYFIALEMEDNTDASTVNFGATSFSFTPPSGFGNW